MSSQLPANEEFFYKEYERLGAVEYDDMNALQKAIVGMMNFGDMARPSGIIDMVVHVGFVSLIDSEDALRRIGRNDLADGVQRARTMIMDCAIRHGLTEEQVVNDFELFGEKFFGERWDREVQSDIRAIENEFSDVENLYDRMGQYLRTQKP